MLLFFFKYMNYILAWVSPSVLADFHLYLFGMQIRIQELIEFISDCMRIRIRNTAS
jgi:hypothetical protein